MSDNYKNALVACPGVRRHTVSWKRVVWHGRVRPRGARVPARPELSVGDCPPFSSSACGPDSSLSETLILPVVLAPGSPCPASLHRAWGTPASCPPAVGTVLPGSQTGVGSHLQCGQAVSTTLPPPGATRTERHSGARESADTGPHTTRGATGPKPLGMTQP